MLIESQTSLFCYSIRPQILHFVNTDIKASHPLWFANIILIDTVGGVALDLDVDSFDHKESIFISTFFEEAGFCLDYSRV